MIVGLLAVILLYAFYRYWSKVKRYAVVETMFPGPPTVPFLGNAIQLFGDSHHIHKRAIRLSNLYRRSFRIWLGPTVFAILQKPADVELLLNNTVHIKKGLIYDSIIPWVQRGLLTSYGDKWKKNRKLLTPTFHFKILDGFLDIFNKNCKTMCDILESQVGSPGFNTFDYVKLCALDNIAETAMGVTIDAQHNPSSDYVKSVKRMCFIVFLRTMRPWYRSDFIFELSSYGTEQKKCLNILQGFTRDIISKRIEERKNLPKEGTPDNDKSDIGMKNKKAFLDLLLQYYDEGSMTIDELQEEVDTFLFEGHDTITSALSFALYNLATHQEIQEKAYREQKEIFGNESRVATVDDLHNMRYLEMVIKESLRLCPSVPAFGRIIETDLKLDDYSYVPAGVEAIVMVPALHRNPDVWEKPDVFDPDRFLPEKAAARHPYSFVPFSAGPRNCIGMKFAMMEMKTTLSNILRRYKLNPSTYQETLELCMEVVLMSRNGANISIQRREPLP